MAFAPTGKLLVMGSLLGYARVWDTATWQETQVLKGHLNEVWALAFSPDGNTLVSSGKDEAVKLWSAIPQPSASQERLIPTTAQFGSLAPDGLRFHLVESNRATIFDTRSLRETGSVTLPNPPPTVPGRHFAG